MKGTRKLSMHGPTGRRERPMILVQLVDKPSIWRGGCTAGLDVFEGLRRVKAISSDKVTAHYSNRSTSAHCTMNEHARIGTRVQRACDVPRRAWEVRRKLRERRVVQGNLRRLRSHRRWERDMARHHG